MNEQSAGRHDRSTIRPGPRFSLTTLLSSLTLFCAVLAGLHYVCQEFLGSGPSVTKIMLAFYYKACGPFYGLLIPSAAIAVFAGACVIARQRRCAPLAAFLPFTMLPLLFGLWGTFDGIAQTVYCMESACQPPRSMEPVYGLAIATLTSFFGLVGSLPAFLLVSLALLVRALREFPDVTSVGRL